MFSEDRLRNFAIKKIDDEFTQDELRQLAYDYLNRCFRGVNYQKWPKDIKEQMASLGVYQEAGTGKPIFDQALKDTWADRALVSEMQGSSYKKKLDQLLGLVKSHCPEVYALINTYEVDGVIQYWEVKS